jgi:hypothetical protein
VSIVVVIPGTSSCPQGIVAAPARWRGKQNDANVIPVPQAFR